MGAAVEHARWEDVGHPLVAWSQLVQRPCSTDLLCEALLALKQHGLLCYSSRAVSCELSGPVQRRHSLVHALMAASCHAGMTETSPICTMGALKVSQLFPPCLPC